LILKLTKKKKLQKCIVIANDTLALSPSPKALASGESFSEGAVRQSPVMTCKGTMRSPAYAAGRLHCVRDDDFIDF